MFRNVYAISIRPERRAAFRTRMPSLSMNTRWVGVDGRLLDMDKLRAAGMKSELKRGQLGCFLSHRSIWQHMRKRKLRYAWVFEDDARWLMQPTKVRQAVNWMNKEHPAWDVLLLGRNPRKKENAERVSDTVVRTGAFWGMFGYIIRGSAVRKLLQDPRTKTMALPCDVLLSRMAQNGELHVFALDPDVISYVDTLRSDTFRIV